MRPTSPLPIILTVLIAGVASAADRIVPELPVPGQRIPVIIDSDAACEIDDLFAIALALAAQDRLDIQAFIGAHFGDSGGPDGVSKSVRAIHAMLDTAGVSGKIPVLPGAQPLRYGNVPEASEGVQFIIDRAMKATPEAPLWLILLGPLTDAASAYLKQPEIAPRVRIFWHGRTRWPETCWNFNAYNDLKAVRTVFASSLPLVLFDTGTYLRCPMDESKEKLATAGPLGKYLHEFRLTKPWFQSPDKGFFDLGDIAALIDPSLTCSETVDAPTVNWDMRYEHKGGHGKILRIHQIDRDRTFGLLYERLARITAP